MRKGKRQKERGTDTKGGGTDGYVEAVILGNKPTAIALHTEQEQSVTHSSFSVVPF